MLSYKKEEGNILKTKKIQKVIVKGLILKKDGSSILLLKTKYGYWDLPGGHLKFGETPEECLERELKEEVGQKVKIKGLSSIRTIILNGRRRKKSPELRHYTVLIYKCELSFPEKQITSRDKDVIEKRWFPLQEVISKGEKLPALSILKEQLLNQIESDIKTTIKIYLRMGELKPYKEIKYK
jgi:ADP-ribose pyrophosphatase YjhB (NUDIX family)